MTLSSKYKKIILLLPFLILVIGHIIINSKIKVPLIFPDEFDYFAQARFFATGNHFNLSNLPFTHFAYALFLAPLFFLSTDVNIIHSLALILNALLISSLYYSLYYIIHNIFAQDKWPSMLLAFVSCLYPAYFVNAFLMWSENLSIPLFAFWLVLFWKLLQKQTWFYYMIFSFIAALLYASHPRFTLLIPVTIIYLIAQIIFKPKRRYKTLAATILLILLTIVAIKLNSYFRAIAWGPGTYFPNNLGQLILDSIWPLSRLRGLIMILLGQILYLIQATHGLFLLSLIFIIRHIFQKIRFNLVKIFNDRYTHWLFFLILTSFSIYLFSAGAFFVSREASLFRADHIIYGRHNETFISIYIALGLVLLWNKKKIVGKYLIYLILGALPLVLNYLDFSNTLKNSVSIYQTSALAPIVYISFNQLNLYTPSIISIIVFFLMSKFRYISFLIVALIFSIYTQQRVIVSEKHNANIENIFISSINLKEELPPTQTRISYDRFYADPKDNKDYQSSKEFDYIRYLRWNYNSLIMQYYNPQLTFDFYNSSIGQFPQSSYYVSWGSSYNENNAKMLSTDRKGDIYLWQKATSTITK